MLARSPYGGAVHCGPPPRGLNDRQIAKCVQILSSIDETAGSTVDARRCTIGDDRRKELLQYLTWHNFVHDGDDQQTSDIPILSLKRLVDHLLRHDLPFAQTFVKARERFPGQWRMIIVADEFTPGSKIRPNNWRKTSVWSVTWAELLHVNPNYSGIWISLAAVRTSLLEKLRSEVGFNWGPPAETRHRKRSDGQALKRRAALQPIKAVTRCIIPSHRGGMPAFLKMFLHELVRYSHMYVQQLAVSFKIETLLMDGDGLRQAMDWFGAAAVKMCFRHCNVVGKRSELVGSGNLVSLTCSDASQFQKLPPKGLEAMQDMLLIMLAKTASHNPAERLARSKYEEICTSVGFRANPYGALADKSLRRYIDFSKLFAYDWAHSLLQDS